MPENETSIFESLPQPEVVYPTLVKRIQSTFIDGLICFALIGLLVALASSINDNSVPLKIVAIILGASYEPLMSRYSRTIGQRITGIRVTSMEPGKKVPLPLIYLRFVVKNALGWVSFLTMHSNKERRALHDYVANSVVVSSRG